MASRAVRDAAESEPALGATANRADASDELTEAEGLHDVVVGTELEQEDAVELVAARGEHDDRYFRARPEHSTHVRSVDVGKPEVEQHEVDAVQFDRVQRRPSSRS